MLYERQAKLLREELEALLVLLADTGSLYNLVKESLTRVRWGLTDGSKHNRPWALLPLIVCEAISGYYEHALPVATALHLLRVAGDVLDDIEDADSSESLSAKYGSAVATNVATTLLILAERAIIKLKEKGVVDYIVFLAMDIINSFYTTACAGQHLDLSFTSKTAVSEDTYFRVAYMKSASTVECACYIGALLANANQELINKFSTFGNNLGMASQIANDIHGITLGSDILKHKITLPVIYALTQADSETRSQLESTFSKQTGAVNDPTPISDLLFRTGAIHYAMAKMEFYKQRALDNLSEAKKAGVKIELLKPFLE
jgi:geranylgeranyl pyrophosphate synthase